jgi:hypothetical protein
VLGKFNAIDLRFDPNSRYTLWSGLIGGFFLQLSYFGTDQSQVGRYLTGRSVAQSRLGLIFNGLAKVPMQFGILFLGMMLFVFHLFVCPPLFFNPAETDRIAAGPHGVAYRALEARQREAFEARKSGIQTMLDAERSGDAAGAAAAAGETRQAQATLGRVRAETVELLKRSDLGATGNDTNYIFLRFVLAHLPAGLIGLVFAAVFAASMNSLSAELNALTSTSVVDVLKRLPVFRWSDRTDLAASRIVTLFWAAFAVAFAEYASRLGTLVEAVNILGSLFYGTILGIFLAAFYLKRVGGTPVFVGAILAEAVVIACFKLTAIGFLWYNLIGWCPRAGLRAGAEPALAAEGGCCGVGWGSNRCGPPRPEEPPLDQIPSKTLDDKGITSSSRFCLLGPPCFRGRRLWPRRRREVLASDRSRAWDGPARSPMPPRGTMLAFHVGILSVVPLVPLP